MHRVVVVLWRLGRVKRVLALQLLVLREAHLLAEILLLHLADGEPFLRQLMEHPADHRGFCGATWGIEPRTAAERLGSPHLAPGLVLRELGTEIRRPLSLEVRFPARLVAHAAILQERCARLAGLGESRILEFDGRQRDGRGASEEARRQGTLLQHGGVRRRVTTRRRHGIAERAGAAALLWADCIPGRLHALE